ncbi:MAG: type II toxin-antitoxin system RelE/ParE family toxin [Saprospiraceae bacterium]|nr:type II toxin-antitoxin system RelE/ParE family toxin [Saprospiraceae bacterium]
MNYKIILASSAEKELYKLQKSEIQKIVSSIDSLKSIPRPKGYKKLKGPEIFFRIRNGNFRIIYSIEEIKKTINILIIRNRKDAYK